MKYLMTAGMQLMFVVLPGGLCRAEEAPPAKFYKLEFVVKEIEGAKVLNARSYALTENTNEKVTDVQFVPAGRCRLLPVGSLMLV